MRHLQCWNILCENFNGKKKNAVYVTSGDEAYLKNNKAFNIEQKTCSSWFACFHGCSTLFTCILCGNLAVEMLLALELVIWQQCNQTDQNPNRFFIMEQSFKMYSAC